MNIQTRHPTTPDEFLRWNEGREGKREFVNGRVVEMMINVTLNHWRLSTRLGFQLTAQLGLQRYDIGPTDFGVRTPAGIRYPDVLVQRFGSDGKVLAAQEPLLLAEVLSPSSIADDFGDKARDYLGIESLLHYLVVAQDDVRVWLWSRQQDGQWSGPAMTDDPKRSVHLTRLGADLDLVSLYDGVVAR